LQIFLGYVDVNPQSEYAPQALWLLAECLEREKNPEKTALAAKALEKLRDQYPEAPEHEKALKKLGNPVSSPVKK
jgi:TolA-binding protein